MTISSQEIANSLLLNRVNHHELTKVLLSYFGNSQSHHKSYKFTKASSDSFLMIDLDDDGMVAKIGDHNLRAQEIKDINASIINSLIENQDVIVGQRVCFSLGKLEGFFRYKDCFQIVPVPRHAPKPTVEYADYPILLEYK